MDEFYCGRIGPMVDHLRDRMFMLTNASGECITARTYPKMTRIIPKVEGTLMTLSAEGSKVFEVDIEQLYKSSNFINVKIWKDDAICVDCGDEAAKWFSKCILGKDEGLRLVFYHSDQPKPVIQDRKYLFEHAPQKDTGTLHDETSFMLMNQGSFDDLNTRIENSVEALQYRPNFLVKGPLAWEEDNWKWIKIGQVVFKNVQPCIRCILTNIDPSTGERNPRMEPLNTLKTYRAFESIASGPWFGIHLGVRIEGNVKLGDEVYVGV